MARTRSQSAAPDDVLPPPPVSPPTVARAGSGSALAARFEAQDRQQVDALWARVRVEVLDPLEAALAHFDPRATEVVRTKYYDVYS